MMQNTFNAIQSFLSFSFITCKPTGQFISFYFIIIISMERLSNFKHNIIRCIHNIIDWSNSITSQTFSIHIGERPIFIFSIKRPQNVTISSIRICTAARPWIGIPLSATFIEGSVTFLLKTAPTSSAIPIILKQSARLAVNSISKITSSKLYKVSKVDPHLRICRKNHNSFLIDTGE